MKKKYYSPEITVVKVQQALPLAISGVESEDPFDIDYGGIDIDGAIIPETKEFNVLDDAITPDVL